MNFFMYKDSKNRPQIRMGQLGCMLGFTAGWLLGALRLDAQDVMGEYTWMLYASTPIASVLGVLFFNFTNWIIDFITRGPFGDSSGKAAPLLGQGEALVKRGEYRAAVDWFIQAHRDHPESWKAQARAVELIASHLNDPEFLVEEQNRLLKMKAAPEGLWSSTALAVGSYWEEMGHPDRALNIYKTFLWKYPEGFDADEVQQRIKNLTASENLD